MARYAARFLFAAALLAALTCLAACSEGGAEETAQVEDVTTEAVVLTQDEDEPSRTQLILPLPLPGTDIEADFRLPDVRHYVISNIEFDEVSRRWAVLYATTDHFHELNQVWSLSDYWGGRLHIQLFDEQGVFLRRIETGLAPATQGWSLRSSDPSIFSDGLLTFFDNSELFPRYVFFDVDKEEYTTAFADQVVMDGNYFLTFTFGWSGDLVIGSQILERGELIAGMGFSVEETINFDEARIQAFDPKNRTAIHGTDYITFALDFDNQTWKMSRHYSVESLGEPIVYNDDWSIHVTNIGFMILDIVALELATGDIHFLRLGGHHDTFALTPDNLLLINRIRGLEIWDVANGEILQHEFGSNYEAKDAWIQGIAYDSERGLFVCVWRVPNWPNDYEMPPIMMTVYTREGELVRSFDTGFADELQIFSHHFPITVGIELDGQGNATLISNQWISTDLIGPIHYLH